MLLEYFRGFLNNGEVEGGLSICSWAVLEVGRKDINVVIEKKGCLGGNWQLEEYLYYFNGEWKKGREFKAKLYETQTSVCIRYSFLWLRKARISR